MKHYGIAIMELIGYTLSWFAAISIFLSADPSEGFFFLLFIFEHPVDAILTYCVAKKGLNPRRGPDAERAQAAQTNVQNELLDATGLEGAPASSG